MPIKRVMFYILSYDITSTMGQSFHTNPVGSQDSLRRGTSPMWRTTLKSPRERATEISAWSVSLIGGTTHFRTEPTEWATENSLGRKP